MVIVRISSGVGSQLFQYATGRQLANKLNTELKLDITFFPNPHQSAYVLDQFNVTGKIATPEEIEPLKKICMNTGLGKEGNDSIQKVLNYPDNIYLDGYWFSEKYFPDIRDILLKEFTLKNSLSPSSEAFKQKILSAECAVSMHFCYGNRFYQPTYGGKPWLHVPPFEYYQNCINTLKQAYKNLTVFVFSDNIQWVEENLHLDVPTEFVESQKEDNFSRRDVEEMYLMSLCKHNINLRSAFSWWGAYLNQNPDKKVFVSTSATAQDTLKYKYSLATDEKSPLDSGKWIYVPFDRDKQPKVMMRPMFSLLLVVNNDAETIAETLESLLAQNYNYYEIIIIDNASYDGSGKICRQAIAGKENVTFKKLWAKAKNSEAWNIALDMAQGYYVLFLKGSDFLVANALSTLYLAIEGSRPDIIHGYTWLMENDNANLVFDSKKCSEQCDEKFIALKGQIAGNNGQDATKLLLNRYINNFLATKLYSRAFLSDKGIKFDESLDDDEVELAFQMKCFFKSKNFTYIPDTFYIATKKFLDKSPSAKEDIVRYIDYAQIVDKFNHYFTARVDISLVPKAESGDFQVLNVSDDRAIIGEQFWLPRGCIGYVLQSYVGNLEFVAKATVDGQVYLHLLGIDRRTPEDNSKFIPYWIDYTKLTVNGKIILDKLTPAWHNKRYIHTMDVKAGDELKIQVEWLPHRSDYVDIVAAPAPKPPATDKVVAPTPKPPATDKVVAPTPKPPATDKVVAPAPKPPATDKVVTPTPKPPANDRADAQMLSNLKDYFTARLDIKFMTTTGDFQILSPSDDKARIWKPDWFQEGGIGYQIESYAGNLEFVAKATVDGKMQLGLKGLDIHDPKDNSKRIPYWIYYTKLMVNGKAIFDALTPAWHDEPYYYDMDVKAGEEVRIQVKWLPNDSNIADKVVAPMPKPPVADKAVVQTPKPPVADKAVVQTPKPPVADKAVVPTPKLPVADKAVAPMPKPPVADKVDSRIFAARLDIKLMTTTGDFQILSVSDNNARIKKPLWFQKDGIGYQINSYAGEMEIIVKATADGRVDLKLLGIDVRDPKDKSKRVPYWADYTKLTVNGKIILDKLTPAWHNEPYRYNMDVKAGEELKIRVEWLPHKSNT